MKVRGKDSMNTHSFMAWKWLIAHIHLGFIFTPFAITRTRYRYDNGEMIGYADVYIFGLRIARIQETKPW